MQEKAQITQIVSSRNNLTQVQYKSTNIMLYSTLFRCLMKNRAKFLRLDTIVKILNIFW